MMLNDAGFVGKTTFVTGTFFLVISKTNVNCIEIDAVDPIIDVASLNRDSFLPGFIFGAGSSLYQVLIENNEIE